MQQLRSFAFAGSHADCHTDIYSMQIIWCMQAGQLLVWDIAKLAGLASYGRLLRLPV